MDFAEREQCAKKASKITANIPAFSSGSRVDEDDNIGIGVTGDSPTATGVVKLKRTSLSTGARPFARLNLTLVP